MVEEVQIAELPTGKLGLYGGRNMTRISGEYLLQADNIAYDEGVIRKEGGASVYNSDLPVFFVEKTNPKNFTLNSVAYNGSIIVAVGAADGTDAYVVTSSDDGETWTERSNPKNFSLNAVTWSSSLSLFVAVGSADGTDGYIITSSDGITWAERSNPKNFALNDVVQKGTSTTIVAVGAADGTDAYIITSTDGITWTERSNPKNFDLNGIGSTPGGFLIAVGAADGTDAYVVTSADGTTWIERSNPKNFDLNAFIFSETENLYLTVGAADGTDAYIATTDSIASGFTDEQSNPKNFALNELVDNGSEIIAVGEADGTDAYVLTSRDAETWTERSNPKNFDLNGIVWTGSSLVAVGAADGTDAYIVRSQSSSDSFTERSNPKNILLSSSVFNGSIYCAVGSADGTDAYIITSTDAITWTERSNPKNRNLNAVEWNGDKFVAVGAPDSGTDGYLITSPDGITWTERSNPKNSNILDIAWNGFIFCAVGASDGTDAYIITSNDGVIWTERANPKSFNLAGVEWNGSIFVAVGQQDGTDSYIVTSPDGITWTEQTNPKNLNLNDISWNGSIFVAVGESDGTDAYIITSPDGSTWTERSNPKSIILQSVDWNGDQFMAVGESDGTDAYVVLSPNGIDWTEVPSPKNINLQDVSWDGKNFVAVGSADGTDGYLLTYNYDSLYLLGASYWNHDGATPKVVTLDNKGRLLMDDYDGDFSTILDSGLTVDSDTYPKFVEGGKEVAANNKKLFIFTEDNAVQVLSGSGTTTSDITSPPADWSSTNQPVGGLVHEFRLWGFGNANDPHRMYFSLSTDHEDFTSDGAGSLSVFPGEGEKIVNAISFKGYIVVFKYPKGIYFVDTTSPLVQNWKVSRISFRIGAAGLGSAEAVENDVIFVDRTGEIRALSGITEFGDIGTRSLSDMNGISTWIRDNYYIPDNTKWRMVYYPTKRELHIAASRNQLGINDSRLVIDFNNQQPMFRHSSRDTCISLFTRELNGIPELMSTDNLGNMYRMDQEDRNKDGLGYSGKIQIPYIDLGNPVQNKNGRYIEIAYEPTGDYDLIIDVIWDGVYYQTVTMNLSAEDSVIPGRMIVQRLVEIGGFGKRFSMIMRNGNPDEDFRIQAAWLHYTLGTAA